MTMDEGSVDDKVGIDEMNIFKQDDFNYIDDMLIQIMTNDISEKYVREVISRDLKFKPKIKALLGIELEQRHNLEQLIYGAKTYISSHFTRNFLKKFSSSGDYAQDLKTLHNHTKNKPKLDKFYFTWISEGPISYGGQKGIEKRSKVLRDYIVRKVLAEKRAIGRFVNNHNYINPKQPYNFEKGKQIFNTFNRNVEITPIDEFRQNFDSLYNKYFKDNYGITFTDFILKKPENQKTTAFGCIYNNSKRIIPSIQSIYQKPKTQHDSPNN